MLGQQFMHNAGAPYKFVIKTSTQPLEECAPVINEVLGLLRERVGMCVPGCEFNESLSVAYMEGQRMDVLPLIFMARCYVGCIYRIDGSIMMMGRLEYEMLLLRLVWAVPLVLLPFSLLCC